MIVLKSRRDRTTFRVWNPEWVGDQFEILTVLEYNRLESQLNRFGLEIQELSQEED